VNSYEYGEINYLEILKKGKSNELKFYLENDNMLLNDETVLNEIKNSLTKEIKIDIILFTELLGVTSAKIKYESKISNFEKVFYIFQKISYSDSAINKIFLKRGNTLYYIF